MRRLVAFTLVVSLAAPPADAQISLLGLRNSLVQFALARISTPDSFEITARGVEESEDGVTELVGVAVADARGVWLEIDGLGLRWSPTRILRGELAITLLQARGVRVLRRPEPASVAIETTVDAPERAPFSWPRAPITTRIDTLRLQDVRIAEDVIADQSLAFDAEGSARDEGDEQAVTLNLVRTDDVEGAIALDYLRDFAANTLRLALNAQEAPGGVVGALAGFPPDSASSARIDASGPLSDWRLTFEAEAEQVVRTEGRATIVVGPPLSIDAEAVVRAGPAMPAAAAEALAPEARLVARATEDAGGVIRIEEGAIRSPELTLDATGFYGRNDGALDLAVDLEAGGGLSALVEGVAFDSFAFDGDVSGSISDLTAEGALALDGLQTAPVDVGEARLNARVTVAGQQIGFDVSGATDRVRLDRIAAETVGRAELTARGAWDGAAATLERLAFDSPLLRLGAEGVVDVAGDAADLAYSLTAPDLAPIAGAYDVDAAGEVAVSGRVEGAFTAPRIVGEAALQEIRYQGEDYGRVALTHDVTAGETPGGRLDLRAEGSRFGPATVGTDFRLADQVLTVSDLTAEALGARATGGLAYDLEAGLADGAINARIVDLAPLAALAEQDVAGSAALDLTFRPEGGTQTVAVTGDVSDARGFGATARAIDLDFTAFDALGAGLRAEGSVAADGLAYDPLDARLDALRFEGRADDLRGAASATGVLTAEGVAAAGAALDRIRLEGEGRDLTGAPAADATLTAEGLAYAPLEAAVATLTLTASASDLIEDPAVQATLEAAGLAGAGATLDGLAATVDATGLTTAPAGTLDATLTGAAYPALDAAVAEATVAASGENLIADPAGRATIAARDLRGAGVAAQALTLEAEGRALLTAPEGTLDAVAEAVAAGDVRTARAALAAALTQTDRGARLVADLDTAAIAAGAAEIGPVAVDATVDDALSTVPRIDARASIGATTLGAVGLSGVDASARGALSALDVALSASGVDAEETPVALTAAARIAAAGAEPPSAVVSAFAANYGDAEAALRAPLRVTTGEATRLQGLDLALPGGGLTGSAALHPNGAAGDLTLALSDVGPLAAIAGRRDVSGAMNLSARFDTRPGAARADLDLVGRDLRAADVAPGLGGVDLDAQADWNGARLAIDAAAAGPFAQPFQLEASTPMRPSGGPVPSFAAGLPVDGRLTWRGRIGELWALVPAVDHVLDGDATIDLGFRGPITAPALEGTVALADGVYQNLETGTILTDLTVSSAVRPDGAFAIEAEANDGAGAPVRATAEIEGGTLDARVTTQGAVLVRRDDATAAISADIAIAGPLAGPDVSGTVAVDRAEVRLVNATPPSVASLGDVRIKGEPIPEPEEPAGEAVALDLTISAPRNVFVRGRGLDSEWMIDMAVRGTAANPIVTGAIERIRGELSLVGAVFDLTRGHIRFTGGPEIDPALDIALMREAQDVTGGIVVRGYASDPEIRFESTPALPEGEVLPRVLFNKSQQSLTPGEALQLAAGLATLLDGTGGFLDGVRSTIGLDVLRVEGLGDDTTVTVGQNLGDGVFLGAKQPLDGGSARVTVEVEVFDNVTVDTEVGSETGTSFGLNWRRDF